MLIELCGQITGSHSSTRIDTIIKLTVVFGYVRSYGTKVQQEFDINTPIRLVGEQHHTNP